MAVESGGVAGRGVGRPLLLLEMVVVALRDCMLEMGNSVTDGSSFLEGEDVE